MRAEVREVVPHLCMRGSLLVDHKKSGHNNCAARTPVSLRGVDATKRRQRASRQACRGHGEEHLVKGGGGRCRRGCSRGGPQGVCVPLGGSA